MPNIMRLWCDASLFPNSPSMGLPWRTLIPNRPVLWAQLTVVVSRLLHRYFGGGMAVAAICALRWNANSVRVLSREACRDGPLHPVSSEKSVLGDHSPPSTRRESAQSADFYGFKFSQPMVCRKVISIATGQMNRTKIPHSDASVSGWVLVLCDGSSLSPAIRESR